MAKKGNREVVAMVCSICKNQNYLTSRNKVNMEVKGKGKLLLDKYCRFCKKVQPHKESSKFK